MDAGIKLTHCEVIRTDVPTGAKFSCKCGCAWFVPTAILEQGEDHVADHLGYGAKKRSNDFDVSAGIKDVKNG